jgi:hypothetical protein
MVTGRHLPKLPPPPDSPPHPGDPGQRGAPLNRSHHARSEPHRTVKTLPPLTAWRQPERRRTESLLHLLRLPIDSRLPLCYTITHGSNGQAEEVGEGTPEPSYRPTTQSRRTQAARTASRKIRALGERIRSTGSRIQRKIKTGRAAARTATRP